MSKSRRQKPYVHRHENVYLLRPTPPKVEEPSPEVKAQIDALEKDGFKTFTLGDDGKVHKADIDPIDLYVAADGCRAASWLIFHQRARFHRSGLIDFKIPVDKETPPWFRVAFEYLRRREDLVAKNLVRKCKKTHFFVHMSTSHGHRHYTIRWEGWGTYSMTRHARSIIAPSNDA